MISDIYYLFDTVHRVKYWGTMKGKLIEIYRKNTKKSFACVYQADLSNE